MTVYTAETVRLREPQYPSTRIIQAGNAVFKESWLVTGMSAENSFLYMGDHLPFDGERISQVLKEARGPEERFEVFDRARMTEVLHGHRAASLKNLDIVWALSAWALPY